MKNNKGFTLVELLAVIVIMGILMMVAIPSVTRTIENSRKDTFVDIAKSYGNAARTLWTSDNLTCNGVVSSAVDDGDYYILINSKEGAKEALPVLVDQGGKSSWGNRDVNGYVRVNISTTPGEDTNNDGVYEVEPRRVTKFYVALSDGTHGIIDDNNLMMDELKRGNVVMTLSEEQLKKVELTVDDGRLDCGKDASGKYSCAEVTPIKNITGVCVDDQTNVGLTGRVEILGKNFETDDWSIVIEALKSNNHKYNVGDTKTVDMGSFGQHHVRLSNLTQCDGTLESQTGCGVVLEFADVITKYKINSSNTNRGGWPVTMMKTFLNNDIYNALPLEIQNAIIPVTVVSGHGPLDTVNFTSTDKVYLLSATEIWGNAYNEDTASNSTRQLDYYAKLNVTISDYSGAKKKYNDSTSPDFAYTWWIRTPYPSNSKYFYGSGNAGVCGIINANLASGVSPAFRIA